MNSEENSNFEGENSDFENKNSNFEGDNSNLESKNSDFESKNSENSNLEGDNSKFNSKWGVQIHWQDGTDKDFEDFPAQMELARQKEEKRKAAGRHPDESSEESETETEGVEKIRKFNQLDEVESESSDEDNEDPGPEKPELRILWAAQNDKLDLVKSLLVEKPGLVAARDSDLYTPLHRAAYNNHIKVVKYLIEEGADPLATTDTGWTPMHSAAKWNNAEIVEILLHAGTPVNTSSEGGLTALHVAAMSSSCRQTLEFLLMQPDIDLSLASNQGDTARDIAVRSGPFACLFDAASPRAIQSYRR